MTTIGTDLDGVLAISLEKREIYRPFHLHKYYAECRATSLCKGDFDFIVTGGKESFRKVTIKWLEEHRVNYREVHFFPNKVRKNNRNLAIFKKEIIEKLEIDVFYEDDVHIVEYLKKQCTNTEIINISF